MPRCGIISYNLLKNMMKEEFACQLPPKLNCLCIDRQRKISDINTITDRKNKLLINIIMNSETYCPNYIIKKHHKVI